MPINYVQPDLDWSRRRAEWVAHYVAKGCSLRKAELCADRKRFKNSMPS